MNSLTTALKHIILREYLIAMRKRGEMLYPVAFFVIVVCLFPLAIGSNAELLKHIAPGVIWVAALLATLLGLDNLLRSDYHDGNLELMVLSPHPLSVLLLAKVIAHWLLLGLPLIILTPLLSLVMQLSWYEGSILCLSLLLGTPILSLIGGIGLGLTLGLRNHGILLALLILPLYVPVLIFGSGSVLMVELGLNPAGQLEILAGLLLLSLSLAPLALAFAVKIGLMEA
ncbi:MAG: heme exporter protein CcmB [Legionellales bacterium]|nr:heme exporter protein CcmB [Legionellales bacterium]